MKTATAPPRTETPTASQLAAALAHYRAARAVERRARRKLARLVAAVRGEGRHQAAAPDFRERFPS